MRSVTRRIEITPGGVSGGRVSFSSGKAPKKLGSSGPSMTCGWRASVLPRRGAVPSTSTIKAMSSGFWRNSENDQIER